MQLARIVRAKDAADRRDQALWRAGEHDQALAGFSRRGRVVIEGTQQQTEDRALEAAHADRQAGKRALVVVQTSNEQLDELNARAQALGVQDGLLAGEHAIALHGRPYGLYAGDEIVLRAASVHPELGAVANGTRGEVLAVADDGQHATVRLTDGREAVWERSELDAGSARLAYVSHTFAAQGQTVDRAHVIADRLADANGTYVALTRARERTHLYASAEHLEQPGAAGAGSRGRQLASLAERLGRSEPELPSISIALAHERGVEREHAEQSAPPAAAEGASQGERKDDTAWREARERDRSELARVRAEAEQAAEQLARARADARLARVTAERWGQDARLAGTRGERLTGQLKDLGWLARRGQRGRTLQAEIVVERDREAQAREQQHSEAEAADRYEADAHDAERDVQARDLAAIGLQRRQLTEATRLARHRRLGALREEQARLTALGDRADQHRLAQVGAELSQLTAGVAAPTPAQLGYRPRLGPERHGPTIGR